MSGPTYYVTSRRQYYNTVFTGPRKRYGARETNGFLERGFNETSGFANAPPCGVVIADDVALEFFRKRLKVRPCVYYTGEISFGRYNVLLMCSYGFFFFF